MLPKRYTTLRIELVDEGKRQFGVAMVSIGENAVWHNKADHAITNHLLKALGQVLRQSLCDGFDDFLSVCRQLGDVFLRGLNGFFGHDYCRCVLQNYELVPNCIGSFGQWRRCRIRPTNDTGVSKKAALSLNCFCQVDSSWPSP